MPRYYCDYCDTYLTHDSVSRALGALTQTNHAREGGRVGWQTHGAGWDACSTTCSKCACVLDVGVSRVPGCSGPCLSLVQHVLRSCTAPRPCPDAQPAVRKQHNSGYKHKVRGKGVRFSCLMSQNISGWACSRVACSHGKCKGKAHRRWL